jgi:hypothetical protein
VEALINATSRRPTPQPIAPEGLRGLLLMGLAAYGVPGTVPLLG